MHFPQLQLRAAGLVILFFAVLALSGAALRRVLPFPEIAGIAEKLTWLAAHGARYDTLFVGSSRVYWQMIPEDFDGQMAAAGRPTRSFNLAYNSMRPPEDSYVLEQALAQQATPLRYVLVEADEIGLKTRAELAGTAREAYWHDGRRMLTLTQQALGARGLDPGWWASWDERRTAWRLWSGHVVPFLSWATNLSRGEPLLRQTPSVPDWDATVGPRRDGFPADPSEILSQPGARRLEADLRTREKTGRAPQLATAAGQQHYADLERRIAAAGAQMILIVPPRTETGRILPDGVRFPTLAVLDFSDPERFPELYLPGNRRDSDHLNLPGARIFTRLLADRMLELPR